MDKPILLTVCKTSQFNYSNAVSIGYNPYSSEYFGGKTINETVMSWTGLQGNRTFDETRNFLFKSSLGNVSIIKITRYFHKSVFMGLIYPLYLTAYYLSGEGPNLKLPHNSSHICNE